jgi:hypothetical protein
LNLGAGRASPCSFGDRRAAAASPLTFSVAASIAPGRRPCVSLKIPIPGAPNGSGASAGFSEAPGKNWWKIFWKKIPEKKFAGFGFGKAGPNGGEG